MPLSYFIAEALLRQHFMVYPLRIYIFHSVCSSVYSLQRGDMLLAMEDYSMATKIDPTKTEALYRHGQHYFKNGWAKIKMSSKWSSNWRWKMKRTKTLKSWSSISRNWQASIQDFTNLLKQDPQNAQARTFRGRAYSNLKMWDPAVQDLSAAIHLNPNNAKAFYYRGCILRKWAHAPYRCILPLSYSQGSHVINMFPWPDRPEKSSRQHNTLHIIT